MSTQRDQQALELFAGAVEQVEPDVWLRAQGADDELIAAVLAQVTADRRSGAFLAQPIALQAAREGQQIGSYRLLRRIGDGGMGTVYLAESLEAPDAPPVALKLLRFDAPDLRQRFALEKRILASLDHPAIAALLDAGTTVDGAPYLVLEYVEGLPLTEFARRNGLSAQARAALMIEVLAAVQYAHGRLVLHRDLKPSNILVQANGRPKLLDFGIAKLIGAGQRGLTLTGPGPMTPEYASPEQVRGLEMDTVSDVYALGVVLYELLTDQRPYDLSRATPSEVERTICTEMPPRPSARVPRLARDFDHIVAKALAKAPRDRYRSCAELAEDLQRLLDGLPVRARAATLGYRASRFIARHRIGLTTTLAVFVALLGLTITAVRNAERAERATAEAVRERDSAREIQSWLERMLAAADPRIAGHSPSAAELLDGASATLASGLHQRPDIERSLRVTLAVAYRGLGLAEPANREAERALALAGPGTSDIDWSTTLRVHAQTQSELGRYAPALDEIEQGLARLGTAQGAAAVFERARGLALKGFMLSRQNDSAGADAAYRAALQAYGDSEDNATERAEVLNNLAVLRGGSGAYAEALKLHDEAHALLEKALGADHPTTLLAAVNSASVRESMGDVAAAEAIYRQILPRLQAQLGAGHADVVRIQSTLGYLLANNGRADEAVTLMRQTVASAETALPSGNPMRAYAESVLGGALLEDGDPAAAIAPLQQSLDARLASLPAGHPLLVASECSLLEAQARTGTRAAVARMDALLASAEADLGAEHPIVARCRARRDRVRE